MADPFVAEVRIFPFNFAPKGWAWCMGQLLPISQNTALFSLLGTTYGGDGKSTFALPNLDGSAVMAPGQGPGLSQHFLGEVSGSETVTLIASETPVHNHGLLASATPGNGSTPGPGVAIGRTVGATPYAAPTPPLGFMNPTAVGVIGGDQPHNNLQPYLTFYFNIALQGVFPPRS
jgi:microcystin-dependent protein